MGFTDIAAPLLLVVLVLGYLLGSIPFGLLLTKAAGLGDIRTSAPAISARRTRCAPATAGSPSAP